MLSFKPKTNKTIEYSYKENMTLDQKHNSIVDDFRNDDETINHLKKRSEAINEKIIITEDVAEKNALKLELKTVTNDINRLKNKRKKYYLNNSEYIFKYFEEKKNIISDANTTASCDIMNVFFNINKKNDVNLPSSDTADKDYIYNYMKNNDDLYFDIDKYIHPNHLCLSCNKGEMIPVVGDGVIVCNKCGVQHPFITDCEKPSYKEPPKEVCFYAYQRINHFREILAQFQAKETTQIPTDVLDNIKFQIKKERITLDELTYKKTKNILKNLGYNKYYEHISYIKNKLGIKPPIMNQKLEKTLCNLFGEIQNPYSKFCPNDRTNFLNYYYTIYKLCELLEQIDYLPLLKEAMIGDRIKRIEQDNIWKKICDEMDWEFIPTE